MRKMRLIPTLLTLTFLLIGIYAQSASAAVRPSATYKAYLNRVYYAKSVRDVSDFFVEKMRMFLESLEGEDQKRRLKRLKKTYVAKFSVKKEEVRGDMAYILATGLAKEWGKVIPCTVRVEMVRETGGWKIMRHSWTSKMRSPKHKPRILK